MKKLKPRVQSRKLIRRIRKEFPNLYWKKYRFINHGWDHFVIILDERIVFRTSKDIRDRYELKSEIGLLAYLKKKVDVGIPEYTYISRDKTLAGYDIVPGKELTPARLQHLTKEEKESAARQLARFITILHRAPKSVINKYHVQIQNYHKEFTRFIRNIKILLYPRLRKKEIKTIILFLNELKNEIGRQFPRRLVHQDLGDIHILWDKKNKQINIIDFSDRSYGDPAIDFTGLLEYGTEFTRRVYRLYKGKKDDRMLIRAKLYYKKAPIYLMMDALRGDPCTFKQGYEMFRRRFKQ